MKNKIIPICISAVMLITGCIMLIIGLPSEQDMVENDLPVDLFNLTDDDVGKHLYYSGPIEVSPVGEDEDSSFYVAGFYEVYGDDESDCVFIGFDAPKSMASAFDVSPVNVDIKCTFHKCDEAMTNRLKKSIEDYIIYIYGIMEMEIPENEIENAQAMLSPYYIEVDEVPDYEGFIFIAPFIIAAAVIILLFTLFGKKFCYVLGAAVGIAVVVLVITLIPKLRTISTVEKVCDGFYTMDYLHNYNCDGYLNADISNNDELIEWLLKEQFYNLPVTIDPENFGCSAFLAETNDGEHLFGRNFDYCETDLLLVHTTSQNGYASYATVDLDFFGVGGDNSISSDSVLAKFFMLAAPYVCMDGFNEMGLGIGILELGIDEVHQDNGNPDLLVYSAIRGILDKCATVDEAIEFLESYDIHTELGNSYHLFITDVSGKSVVVEWIGNEMFVTESPLVTNHMLCENNYDFGNEFPRFDTIKNKLAETNGTLTADEAMTLLSDVSQEKNNYATEWSCVYNLTDFTVDICLDNNYDAVYSFVTNKETERLVPEIVKITDEVVKN